MTHARAGRLATALGLVTAIAVSAGCGSHASGVASTANDPSRTVAARITRGPESAIATPVYLSLAPGKVKAGSVVIAIRNGDPTESHRLSINGVSSRVIRPGADATMRVRLERTGKYVVQVNLTLSESGGSAILVVTR
jgi:hypothetical protein